MHAKFDGKHRHTTKNMPFDHARLDRLMDEEGIDVVIATSMHVTRYLLGGYRTHFFHAMDAVGNSRYLPVLIYIKGDLEKCAFVGGRLEGWEWEITPLWPTQTWATSSATRDAMQKAVEYLRKAGVATKRIAVELAFLPMDAGLVLREAFASSEIVDAQNVLERLRAIKSPEELAILRTASEQVIDSMLAVIAGHGPGATKQELSDALRREELNRGLTFDYCLIATGSSHNRAASSQRWEAGEVLSLDSGGNYYGYIGDLCRMAFHGRPDDELLDLLGEVEEIQRAAFAAVKPGAMGQEVYTAGEGRLSRSPHKGCTHFQAHGMGIVSHEAPRLMRTGAMSQGDNYADRPLEAGMVLSIETTMTHPRRGFIKLEDTLAVTPSGFEIFGEGGRGWNIGGSSLRKE